MKIKLPLYTKGLQAIGSRRYKKFMAAVDTPILAQKQVLSECLQLAGKSHLPDTPTNYSDYPLNQSWTEEKVNFFEPTSGSSAKGHKNIPYTKSLLRSFQSMFYIWSHDVLKQTRFKTGKTFLSISPSYLNQGTEEETEYLSGFSRWLLKDYIVKPPKSKMTVNKDWMTSVAQCLAECEDLEVMSIWSPSYLFSLKKIVSENYKNYKLSSQRREHLMLNNWSEFWPELKLISSWGSSTSQNGFNKIKSIYPKTWVQKKGLLATEAPITVPISSVDGCGLPLWLDVYLEVLLSDQNIIPLHSLQKHQKGELLLTSKGGLLRYSLGDKIQCVGYKSQSPIIEFLGRDKSCSDLVGEKLEGEWLQSLPELKNKDWLLLPYKKEGICGYYFLANEINDIDIDTLLNQNYHYRLARRQRQLAPSTPIQIQNIHLITQDFFSERGIRRGDIKDFNLMSDLATAGCFSKYLVDRKHILPSCL